ncbi:hypothetical protein L596_004820 [Steinernema carpocapsae]|uniref:DM domain-containing protein n=1 Tax=Steinernema carpocapsae TaxID=34508 RepID=A0A4U8UY25_STECR|nr:hypothetical protein L596_004820 [Steinernema carpocapsae]
MTNHAGQQLKGIFEGSPGPAMEDVEVEKQSSQSPRSRSESSMSEAASPNSQKSRVLYCRKCEGHGVQAILKGHAPTCPYNLCNCKSCEKLMTKRMHSLAQ